jgi:site-specific DNA-methyltransferase (adenine-specific)
MTGTTPIDVIIQGDCLEEMKKLPDGCIDMILCDLPYGTTACKWDHVIPFEPLWKEYKRLIKDRVAIVLTASQPFTTDCIISNRQWFKYCWIWEKSQPGDCMNAKNKPMKAHEDIIIFSSGTTANRSEKRMVYNPQGLLPSGRKRTDGDNNPGKNGNSFRPFRSSHHPYTQEWTNYPTSVLHFDNERGVDHPTQKPVALFEYLIKTYTNEGDLVLDNCIGSGTTAVAAKRTGRHFIGIELSEEYCEIARKRVAAVPARLDRWVEAEG